MSHELNSSKLSKTDIHEFYFKLYMQLNLFWSAENENFGKILAIFFTYVPYLSSTVSLELRLTYLLYLLRTVRLEHTTRWKVRKYGTHAKFVLLRYISTVKFLKFAMLKF